MNVQIVDLFTLLVYSLYTCRICSIFYRFCPSMLLYLVCVVPLLWALELNEISRLRSSCDQEPMSNNFSLPTPTTDDDDDDDDDGIFVSCQQ